MATTFRFFSVKSKETYPTTIQLSRIANSSDFTTYMNRGPIQVAGQDITQGKPVNAVLDAVKCPTTNKLVYISALKYFNFPYAHQLYPRNISIIVMGGKGEPLGTDVDGNPIPNYLDHIDQVKFDDLAHKVDTISAADNAFTTTASVTRNYDVAAFRTNGTAPWAGSFNRTNWKVGYGATTTSVIESSATGNLVSNYTDIHNVAMEKFDFIGGSGGYLYQTDIDKYRWDDPSVVAVAANPMSQTFYRASTVGQEYDYLRVGGRVPGMSISITGISGEKHRYADDAAAVTTANYNDIINGTMLEYNGDVVSYSTWTFWKFKYDDPTTSTALTYRTSTRAAAHVSAGDYADGSAYVSNGWTSAGSTSGIGNDVIQKMKFDDSAACQILSTRLQEAKQSACGGGIS